MYVTIVCYRRRRRRISFKHWGDRIYYMHIILFVYERRNKQKHTHARDCQTGDTHTHIHTPHTIRCRVYYTLTLGPSVWCIHVHHSTATCVIQQISRRTNGIWIERGIHRWRNNIKPPWSGLIFELETEKTRDTWESTKTRRVMFFYFYFLAPTTL